MTPLKKILRDNLRPSLAAAAIFLSGIPAGILMYPHVADQLPNILGQVFAGVMEGSTGQIIVNVFLRNLSASALMMLFGMTVILGVASLFANGLLVGLVATYSAKQGITVLNIVYALLPHAVFELPAIFLSAGMGLNIGATLIKTRSVKETSEKIRQASAAYLVVVIPFLAVAAAIEVLISTNLVN